MNPFDDSDPAEQPAVQPLEDDGMRGFALVLEKYHTRSDVRVVVPDGVTQILPCAFAGHAELEAVELPESVQSIGAEAFANCTSLREMRIPSAVFELGERAFAGCTALKRVELPDGLLALGESTFAQCSQLEEVAGGAEADGIGAQAFSGCSRLAGLPLLSHVKAVGSGAFSGCAFEELCLPPSLERIDAEAFRSCRHLARVSLPETVASLGKNLFAGCFKLCEVGGIEALLEAFPDAFPRAMAEERGVMRPQDFERKAREYQREHAAEADEAREAVEACRARLRALRREHDGLGVFERARKQQVESELAARKREIAALKARLDELENPTWEVLAADVRARHGAAEDRDDAGE